MSVQEMARPVKLGPHLWRFPLQATVVEPVPQHVDIQVHDLFAPCIARVERFLADGSLPTHARRPDEIGRDEGPCETLLLHISDPESARLGQAPRSVSYTHLTLPTICSV